MSERRPWRQQRRRVRGVSRLSWTVLGLGLCVTVGAIWSTPVGGSIAAVADEAVAHLPAVRLPDAAEPTGRTTTTRAKRAAGEVAVAPVARGGEDDERVPAAGAAERHDTGDPGSEQSPPVPSDAADAESRSTGDFLDAAAPLASAAPPTSTRSGESLAAASPPAAAAAAAVDSPSIRSILTGANRYFGLYTAEAPFDWKDFDAISDQLAYRPQVVGYFQGWDKPFRADAVVSAWRHGQLPMLTWEPIPSATANNVLTVPGYSLRNVVQGDFDVYLHEYARAISSTRMPVVIRLAHEMNSTWYPWVEDDGHGNAVNGNAQGDYVRMWQHVHDVFEAEGANRYVAWLWSPNIVNNLTRSHQTEPYLRSLYPGDAYVDLVGLSGYLRPNYRADNTFTFSYTFDRSLAQLRAVAPGKRILLAEVGSSDIGGHKAAWTTSVFSALQDPANEDVLGLVWFDRTISTVLDGAPLTNDFRLEADPAALDAARTGLASGAAGFGSLPAR